MEAGDGKRLAWRFGSLANGVSGGFAEQDEDAGVSSLYCRPDGPG